MSVQNLRHIFVVERRGAHAQDLMTSIDGQLCMDNALPDQVGWATSTRGQQASQGGGLPCWRALVRLHGQDVGLDVQLPTQHSELNLC